MAEVSRRDRQHRDWRVLQPPQRHLGRKGPVLGELPQQRHDPEPVPGHDHPPPELHRIPDGRPALLAGGHDGAGDEGRPGRDGGDLRAHVFFSPQLRSTDAANGLRSPHPSKPILSARQLGRQPPHGDPALERKDRRNRDRLRGLSRRRRGETVRDDVPGHGRGGHRLREDPGGGRFPDRDHPGRKRRLQAHRHRRRSGADGRHPVRDRQGLEGSRGAERERFRDARRLSQR
mmetsp:Transcript_9209/g.22602  ORF Transcript_9209/g.22602 Transcript_9209/m.22602 type:complete len:232 (-) Transcript_9209:1355-2050(-)